MCWIWNDILNDQQKAEIVLLKAEKILDKTTSAYSDHAEKWNELNNKQEAWKWMEKATDIAKTTEDWVECAESWFTLFQLESECKAALEKARESIQTDEDKEAYEAAERLFELALEIVDGGRRTEVGKR